MIMIDFHDLASHDRLLLRQDGKREFVISAMQGLSDIIRDELYDEFVPLNGDAPGWHRYIHAGICIIFRYGHHWCSILMIEAVETNNLHDDPDFMYKLHKRYRLLEGKKQTAN